MFQNRISNGLRRAASLPAELAFRASNTGMLFERIERQHARACRAAAAGPGLTSLESAIVDGLDRNGVFITSLDALCLGPQALTAGQSLAALLQARVEKLPTLPHHIEAEPDETLAYPDIYRSGLSPVLLRIARAYLRQEVAYDGALLFHTPADGREQGTRQWHLDREDRRMIKVALYLNDVDDGGGPFELLRQESHQPGTPYDYTVLDTAGLEQRRASKITADQTVTCTGPSGTLVFADTARFYHRGKPATHTARSAIFYSYFARVPRHPFFCGRARLTRSQIGALTHSMTQAQKACALWRDTLPLMARLVPASRI